MHHKIQGYRESRRYAVRHWNDGDVFACITLWYYDVDESYKAYQDLSSEFTNAEWIEEIVHSLSGRGTEACDCEVPNIYNHHKG